jgi:hypothetical protein
MQLRYWYIQNCVKLLAVFIPWFPTIFIS